MAPSGYLFPSHVLGANNNDALIFEINIIRPMRDRTGCLNDAHKLLWLTIFWSDRCVGEHDCKTGFVSSAEASVTKFSLPILWFSSSHHVVDYTYWQHLGSNYY